MAETPEQLVLLRANNPERLRKAQVALWELGPLLDVLALDEQSIRELDREGLDHLTAILDRAQEQVRWARRDLARARMAAYRARRMQSHSGS